MSQTQRVEITKDFGNDLKTKGQTAAQALFIAEVMFQ